MSTDNSNENKMSDSLAAATNAVKPKTKAAPAIPLPTPPAVPPQRNAFSSLGNVASAIAPSSHKRAVAEVVINDEFGHSVAFNMSFLGAGQGGGRIADSFYQLGYRRVAAVNTTAMDFDGLSPDILKLDLKVGGAAKDTEFAKAQLQGREEEVWDLLTRAWGTSTDYGLICVSLGGGTGSGTAVSLVRTARKFLENQGKPPRVGAIVSLPTINEGQLVARNAYHTFNALLAEGVSPLLVIDNSKINTLYHPPMSKLHATANNTVSQLFHLFNTLCEAPDSIYTFDRSEFAQLLDNGIVVMGAAALQDINSPADISTAIRDQLTGNVLADVNIGTGRKGACLFVASQEELDRLPEEFFAAGFDQLERTLGTAGKAKESGAHTVIHRGLSIGQHPGIQVYMMISQLDPPAERLEALAKKANLSRDQMKSSSASFLGVDG